MAGAEELGLSVAGKPPAAALVAHEAVSEHVLPDDVPGVGDGRSPRLFRSLV